MNVNVDADLDELGLVITRRNPRKRVSKVKPKVQSEDDLHYAVAKLLSSAIARPGVCSSEMVLWMSLEGRAKRSIYEGARNRRRGCVSGVPDIMIVSEGRTYWIELKRPKGGVVSDAQKDMHRELRQAGNKVAICKSLDDVKATLEFWEIPHRKVKIV